MALSAMWSSMTIGGMRKDLLTLRISVSLQTRREAISIRLRTAMEIAASPRS